MSKQNAIGRRLLAAVAAVGSAGLAACATRTGE